MECPSCGSRVSRGAATCAVCGEGLQPGMTSVIPRKAILTAQMERRYAAAAAAPAPAPATLPIAVFETVAVSEIVPQAGVSGSLAMAAEVVEELPEPEPESGGRLSGVHCPSCSEELEYEAHFCSQCGTHVETPMYPSGPVPSAALPDVEPAVRAESVKPARNTLHLVSPPPDTIAADPAELLPPPAPRRQLSDLFPDADIRTIALVCACAALIAAAGVHLAGPRTIPGFTPAEVDLKIQLRAAQWLLAGILAALVGLLARR
jgi:hypothetical protein